MDRYLSSIRGSAGLLVLLWVLADPSIGFSGRFLACNLDGELPRSWRTREVRLTTHSFQMSENYTS